MVKYCQMQNCYSESFLVTSLNTFCWSRSQLIDRPYLGHPTRLGQAIVNLYICPVKFILSLEEKGKFLPHGDKRVRRDVGSWGRKSPGAGQVLDESGHVLLMLSQVAMAEHADVGTWVRRGQLCKPLSISPTCPESEFLRLRGNLPARKPWLEGSRE